MSLSEALFKAMAGYAPQDNTGTQYPVNNDETALFGLEECVTA